MTKSCLKLSRNGLSESHIEPDAAKIVAASAQLGGSFSTIPDRLLTVPEVATRLGMTPAWIYRHASKLGAYHLGKYLRFSWNEVLLALKDFRLGAEPNDHDETQN